MSILVILTTSCSKVTLREEIKEYILGCSLKEAKKEYKHASYSYITTAKENEVETSKREITCEFDVSDYLNCSYSYVVNEYENGELKSSLTETIATIDSKYIYTDSKGESEYNLTQVLEKIDNRFFYKEIQLDGTYHYGGMYYGDVVREMAPKYQNTMSVDENGTLKLAYDYVQKDGNATLNVTQILHVSSIGMLIDQNVTKSNGTITVYDTIQVTKLD